MAFMKRKRNVATTETKLETIDQRAIGVRVSFVAVRYDIGIAIRLSEPLLIPINSDIRRSTVLHKKLSKKKRVKELHHPLKYSLA